MENIDNDQRDRIRGNPHYHAQKLGMELIQGSHLRTLSFRFTSYETTTEPGRELSRSREDEWGRVA